MNRIRVQTHIRAHKNNRNNFAFHFSAMGRGIYTCPGVGCPAVSGGWISWNYNQLSQAKAEAETEFGKNVARTANIKISAKSFFT